MIVALSTVPFNLEGSRLVVSTEGLCIELYEVEASRPACFQMTDQWVSEQLTGVVLVLLTLATTRMLRRKLSDVPYFTIHNYPAVAD